jgi:hypothetical protein
MFSTSTGADGLFVLAVDAWRRRSVRILIVSGGSTACQNRPISLIRKEFVDQPFDRISACIELWQKCAEDFHRFPQSLKRSIPLLSNVLVVTSPRDLLGGPLESQSFFSAAVGFPALGDSQYVAKL